MQLPSAAQVRDKTNEANEEIRKDLMKKVSTAIFEASTKGFYEASLCCLSELEVKMLERELNNLGFRSSFTEDGRDHDWNVKISWS